MSEITPEDVNLYTQNMNKIIKLFKNIPEDPVIRMNLQRLNAEEQLKNQREYELQQQHFKETGRVDLVDYSEEERRIIQETPEAMSVTEFQLLQWTGESLKTSKTRREDKNYYQEGKQRPIIMPLRNAHVTTLAEPGHLSPGTELRIKGAYQPLKSNDQHSIPNFTNENQKEIHTREIPNKPYINKYNSSSQLPRHSYGVNGHDYFPNHRPRFPYHPYDFKPSYRGKRRRGH